MGFHRVLLLPLTYILLVRTVSGNFKFQSFNTENNSLFTFYNSGIAFESLQVTAETVNPEVAYSLENRDGRVIFNYPYRLWKDPNSPASFNSTFVFNIAPAYNKTAGEGMAFIISSNKDIRHGPDASHGRWLGLFNSSIDGLRSNKMVAVEFDTVKSNGTNDPDDNHVAIDVNSINSTKNASLDVGSINLKSEENITVWIRYSGIQKLLKVYIAKTPDGIPSQPVLRYPISLAHFLDPLVNFSFTASTGNNAGLNCVHSWSLEIEELETCKPNWGLKIGLLVSEIALALLLFLIQHKHAKYIRKSNSLI